MGSIKLGNVTQKGRERLKQYQYVVTLEFMIQAETDVEALEEILSRLSVPDGGELYARPLVARRRESAEFISLPIKKEVGR